MLVKITDRLFLARNESGVDNKIHAEGINVAVFFDLHEDSKTADGLHDAGVRIYEFPFDTDCDPSLLKSGRMQKLIQKLESSVFQSIIYGDKVVFLYNKDYNFARASIMRMLETHLGKINLGGLTEFYRG